MRDKFTESEMNQMFELILSPTDMDSLRKLNINIKVYSSLEVLEVELFHRVGHEFMMMLDELVLEMKKFNDHDKLDIINHISSIEKSMTNVVGIETLLLCMVYILHNINKLNSKYKLGKIS